jgi:hypothetical protein
LVTFEGALGDVAMFDRSASTREERQEAPSGPGMGAAYFWYSYLALKISCWKPVPVSHACNPSYSGGRDQEDHSLKQLKQTV